MDEFPEEKTCMTLDFEGFFVQKQFQVRELGCVSHTQDHHRYAFHPKTPYSALSVKDQRTVQYVRKHVHGLSFISRPPEHAQQQHAVSLVVKALYEIYKTDTKTLVAFKSGHVEKDLLNKLNIPWTDLEKWGSPKYSERGERIPQELSIPSCGYHLNDNIHHCPVTECSAFWRWCRYSV